MTSSNLFRRPPMAFGQTSAPATPFQAAHAEWDKAFAVWSALCMVIPCFVFE